MKKILLTLILCLSTTSTYAIYEDDIAELYASLVDQWKAQISVAFDTAEKEIFNIDPPVVPVGPNEDPAKCVCKGTGTIVQGDGHTTPCPFHSKSDGE